MWSEANFIGGHPILDFLNTVSDRGKSRSASTLTSPADLVSWIEASAIRESVAADRVLSQATFDTVMEFREATYRALVAAIGRDTEQDADLQKVAHSVKNAVQRASFDVGSAPTIWHANQTSDHYHLDFFALLLDDFLRTTDMQVLCQCERCTWLFLNSGRGRGRKWCSMTTCGNRHKVELHRTRSHDQSGGV
jgi:predicted RNA-binding Zn ribbon-like protein